jgi:hypothetical protein
MNKIQNRNAMDIETAPRPIEEIYKLKPDFKAPANFKDPFKIAENLKEQEETWLRKAALSPITGCIVVLGVKPFGAEPIILEGEERDILLGWWEIFNEGRTFAEFFGHGLKGFDMPFVIKRSWLHGIKVPMDILFPGDGRFLNSRRFHCTMQAFQCGDMKADWVGLDAVSKFFGLEGKTEDLGPLFADVYKTDRARALSYFTRDLEQTEAVANIMFPEVVAA